MKCAMATFVGMGTAPPPGALGKMAREGFNGCDSDRDYDCDCDCDYDYDYDNDNDNDNDNDSDSD